MQTMRQSPGHFNEIARFNNFDFQQKAGIMTSLPFNLSWWFTTRLNLRYAFAHSRAVLTAYCQDLFQTRSISPTITWAHQRLRTDFSCYRVTGITFTYKFGGYKGKRREEVDTSRMRK
ncbi:MAG: hypothetical protein IJV33_08570 [Bacteroidaceae bacterium]|nr:hypothetical protein [Bacteroidaceae bacterium]